MPPPFIQESKIKLTLTQARTAHAPSSAERYQAPEALFDPSLLGVEAPGVAALVHACIAVRAMQKGKGGGRVQDRSVGWGSKPARGMGWTGAWGSGAAVSSCQWPPPP